MATDTMRRTPKTVPGRRGAQPDPRTRLVTAPRHTRPATRTGPGPAATRPPAPRTDRPPAPRTAGSRPRARSARMPFILLLVGLLGGALVSLLVISTTLAQGAFRITNLQEQNASLVRQEQSLTNEIAQAGNPAVIAKKAEQLGMRPNPDLKFINLKTGKVVSGKVSSAAAAINVPGYTP